MALSILEEELFLSIFDYEIEKAEYLLDEKGVNVNCQLPYNLTRHSISIRLADKLLRKKECNETVKESFKYHSGWTPIYIAVVYSAKFIMSALLSRGADINIQAQDGSTPFHFVSYHGDYVRASILSHCKPKLLKDLKGISPMHVALYEDNVDLCFNINKDLEIRDNLGRTPLHVGVFNFNFTGICRFLELGANINAQDNEGFTPLHRACQDSHECIRYLLEYGADVNIRNNDGFKPYHYIIEKEFDDPKMKLSNRQDWSQRPDFNRDDDYSKHPKENMLLHLYKLKLANIHVGEIPPISNFDPEWIQQYHHKCKLELENMKTKTIITTDVLVSDLISHPINRLITYIDFKSMTNSIIEIVEDFPLYSMILSGIIWRGQRQFERKQLLNTGIKSLCALLPSLSVDVVCKIVTFYLDCNDINALDQVFNP